MSKGHEPVTSYVDRGRCISGSLGLTFQLATSRCRLYDTTASNTNKHAPVTWSLSTSDLTFRYLIYCISSAALNGWNFTHFYEMSRIVLTVFNCMSVKATLSKFSIIVLIWLQSLHFYGVFHHTHAISKVTNHAKLLLLRKYDEKGWQFRFEVWFTPRKLFLILNWENITREWFFVEERIYRKYKQFIHCHEIFFKIHKTGRSIIREA